MRTIRVAGNGLVAIALMMACSDGNTPTDVTSTPTAQLDFTNNPDAGPRIVRYGSGFGWIIIDPRSGLFSLQATDQGFCNPPEFLTVNVQDILSDANDPDVPKIEELVLGRDLHILVFEDFFGWDFTCEGLDSRLLARGTGNLTYTDSDVLSYLRDNRNHEAFGVAAQGRLELVAGGTASYAGVEKCQWDGIGDSRCVDHIALR